MKQLTHISMMLGLVLLFCGNAAADLALYERIYAQYPRSTYIVGIGEAPTTGSALRDRRVAEVMARRELAAQIRVQVSEVAIDIACSGGDKSVIGTGDACRDEFSSVLETRVDEFIQGSRIVMHGERQGRIFAVAVMERKGAAKDLQDEAEVSVERMKGYIEKAKAGDPGARAQAKQEYLKARASAAQSDALAGVRGRAEKLFKELDEEIGKLGGAPKN